MLTAKGRPVTITFSSRLELNDYERVLTEAKSQGMSLCAFVNKAVLAALPPAETGNNESGD